MPVMHWKRMRAGLAPLLFSALALCLAACGGDGQRPPAWEGDPIVPGYSMAMVSIGDPFSAAQAEHGDPVEHRKDGGYLYAYYGRLDTEGRMDAPGTWHLVITLYDNGNGYLDGDDEIGAVEVAAPYSGTTAGKVGMGSGAEEVEAEFGPCENVTATAGAGGAELELYSYTGKGVDFLLSGRDGVMMVMVTAGGGLRQVGEEGRGKDAQGGLFGTHQADPIVPGQTAAGIGVGEEYLSVREKYGSPDSSGFTTERLVYATYTGGYGTWKLNVYFEDRDKSDTLGDYDTVVSISVRHPYAGKTPKGVGIGSPQADVTREFGSPERQSTLQHQGEETTIMEYNSKGIVFALKMPDAVVVEVDVNRPLLP